MPVINWLSGENKPIVSIPGTREIFSNGSLYFLPFQPSNFRPDVHTAAYKCTATNNVGKIVSREVKVRAGQWKFLSLFIHDMHAYRGAGTLQMQNSACIK
jgi:hypothetical protein